MVNVHATAQHRRLTIGVTGHRPNRMHVGEAELGRRLRLVLAALRQGARRAGRCRPHAISSIAEGADRLFADAALALGYRLLVLLPFASADYETTFSDQTSTPHFRALLGSAIDVVELPGSLGASKAAYEASGRAIVDRSDIIIAVWDGKPAAGRGGTPEIIEYAATRGKPVLWIDAARVRLPRLIAAPTARGRREFQLSALASRAKELTATRIAILATLSLIHI